jgi:hypothetical protein
MSFASRALPVIAGGPENREKRSGPDPGDLLQNARGLVATRYRVRGSSSFPAFSCAAITRAISISIVLEVTGLAM